jgi:hypothetical protein
MVRRPLAFPPLPAEPTSNMLALSYLSPVRPSVLRQGRGCILRFARPSDMEALLGYMVGHVNANRCAHCAAGYGIWLECVSVPGFWGGGAVQTASTAVTQPAVLSVSGSTVRYTH